MIKYIICGIAPGFGGVGKLMEYLDYRLDNSKYVMLYPKTFSFKNRYIRWTINQISKQIFFKIKLRVIKNKNILLMHHQSIGLSTTKFLINNNKNIDFYIMDNSFFCIKSYNYMEGKKECIDCVGGKFENAIKNSCKVFPYRYSIKNNLSFLRYLKKNAKKIKFYALSISNANLIKKHFGNETFVKVIYFLTNDILRDQKNSKFLKSHNNGYDIVFHASDIGAKGFSYIQELAEILDQYTFLIPTKKKLNNKKENIDTKYMEWETGLKEAVINAHLVLTPSLWSNTPEAATLKSFLYNGSVGIIKNEYGFANDIDQKAYLQLSGDKIIDTKIIDNFLKEKRYINLRKNGKIFIDNYFENANKAMQKFFSFNNIMKN